MYTSIIKIPVISFVLFLICLNGEIMSKVINTYPDWVEKYRGKGKTIRKTAYGYGLYKCTSVYDKKKGYPRSCQEFLGMIDEKKGFIPKVKKNANPEYIEYGLSSFIMANFKRDLVRSSYGTSNSNLRLIKIGIINFIFGFYSKQLLKYSYLTYEDIETLDYVDVVNPIRVKKISNKIDELFKSKISSDIDRLNLINILKLSVIDKITLIKPVISDEVKDIVSKEGLKLW